MTTTTTTTVHLPKCKHNVSITQINVNEEKQDTAIVFLHHATGSVFDWRDQLSFFSNEGYNCMAYDRIGFGHSIVQSSMNESTTITETETETETTIMKQFPLDYYERSVEELSDVLNSKQYNKVILCGHSDGATIALLAASGQNSSTTGTGNSVSKETLEQLKNKIVGVIAEAPHMWYDQRQLLNGFQQFNTQVRSTEKFWTSTAKDHQNNLTYAKLVVDRWQDLWLNRREFREKWDERHCLKHIDVPVLVTHGQLDPFFPVEHAKFISDEIKISQFVLFPDAAHTAHRQIKQQYNSTVLSFLKRYQSTAFKLLVK